MANFTLKTHWRISSYAYSVCKEEVSMHSPTDWTLGVEDGNWILMCCFMWSPLTFHRVVSEPKWFLIRPPLCLFQQRFGRCACFFSTPSFLKWQMHLSCFPLLSYHHWQEKHYPLLSGLSIHSTLSPLKLQLFVHFSFLYRLSVSCHDPVTY